MHTSVLKIYVSHTQSPSAQNSTTLLPLSFSPGTLKVPVMPALINPFRSTIMQNLYPFLMPSRVLSILFQDLSFSSPSPSLELYPTMTQTLILENLNLIQRILELTYLNFITALCHTSLIGQPPLSKLFPYPEHRQ